jgi:hypothetical protein
VGELFPRVGFIVNNSNMKAIRVMATPNEKINWQHGRFWKRR